jgi:hypothetical protein
VSASLYHTCALKANGDVACWGNNSSGQVGGAPTQFPYFATAEHQGPFTQLSAAPGHTCALRSDRSIACWGYDSYGQATPPLPWAGFFQPVDNPGPIEDVVNRAKAGVGVPVKFSLGGDRGLAIFKPGYPKFTYVACDASTTDAPLDATTASPGGLSYDATSGQYTYVWKTDKAWAGSCGTFDLGLVDRTDHHALFRFVR